MINAFYEHGQWVVYTNERLGLEAGALMTLGIGTPSDHVYIDTWSFSSGNETAREAVEREKRNYADRTFIPVFVKPTAMANRRALAHAQHVRHWAIFMSALWPRNLFRTVYVAALALYTLADWTTIHHGNVNVTLLLHSDPLDPGLSGLLAGLFSGSTSLVHAKDDGRLRCFSSIIMGLTRKGVLEEREVMMDGPETPTRSTVFRKTGEVLKKHIVGAHRGHPRKGLTVVLVLRRSQDRRILNAKDLAAYLSSLEDAVLEVHYLEDYALAEQIGIMSHADVVVAQHGAVFAHIFWMRKGALVVELFPYGFRKSIYRNLASLCMVQYVAWEVARRSGSRFPSRRLVRDAVRLERKVDWESQESKDLWRDQDMIVDVVDFERTFGLAMGRVEVRKTHSIKLAKDLAVASEERQGPDRRDRQGPDRKDRQGHDRKERYLMFMAWEQFNNQLIGLRSACAAAIFLNRTLVLPPLGYRLHDCPNRRSPEDRQPFHPALYQWHPLTRYFSPHAVSLLPCRTVPFDAFTSLTKRVRRIHLRHLHQSRFVMRRQLEEYYWKVARIEYEVVSTLLPTAPVYMTASDIVHYLGRYAEPTLALGSLYWLYTFGSVFDYPLTRYFDLMRNPLYWQIAAALQHYHPDLVAAAKRLGAAIAVPFVAVHLRRGDYRSKCWSEVGDGAISAGAGSPLRTWWCGCGDCIGWTGVDWCCTWRPTIGMRLGLWRRLGACRGSVLSRSRRWRPRC